MPSPEPHWLKRSMWLINVVEVRPGVPVKHRDYRRQLGQSMVPPTLRGPSFPELMVLIKRLLNPLFSKEGGDVLECISFHCCLSVRINRYWGRLSFNHQGGSSYEPLESTAWLACWMMYLIAPSTSCRRPLGALSPGSMAPASTMRVPRPPPVSN